MRTTVAELVKCDVCGVAQSAGNKGEWRSVCTTVDIRDHHNNSSKHQRYEHGMYDLCPKCFPPIVERVRQALRWALFKEVL